MKKIIRIAALAATGLGIATFLSGCVVAPAPYGYGYGYSAPVVAPTVGIGVYGGRGYYGHRYWR